MKSNSNVQWTTLQMSVHLMKAIKVLFRYCWSYLSGHYTRIMSANEAFLKYSKYPLLLEGGVLASCSHDEHTHNLTPPHTYLHPSMIA